MVRDGWWFVLPLFLLALAAGGAAKAWGGGPGAWIPAVLFLLLACFCAYFFRDPSRITPLDPAVLVSPADGKVILIQEGHDAYAGACREIHIFMNVFNVHVQRSPFTVPCRVGAVSYHPGKFLVASRPKASLENEQNWIGLEAGGRKVLVKQIAGLIARRVVCWVKQGDSVGQGARIGMIRFGSQVDLLVPKDAEILVKAGDTVASGETLMARFPQGR
jgi:phosphatidylserine decarboxylase